MEDDGNNTYFLFVEQITLCETHSLYVWVQQPLLVKKVCMYQATSTISTEVASKAKNLRSTLSKLFNRPKVDSEDFVPTPERKRSKGKGKGPMKKKVKEFKFKVVGMKVLLQHTPTGPERDSKVKMIWIRETATAWEIERKIYEEYDWDSSL